MLKKIVSGGQTGVDRAALDVAISLQIDQCGWCPKGRRAEDGVIPEKYCLNQTTDECYEERTLLNIRDSDGTLVLVPPKSSADAISDGTKLTIEELNTSSKPYLVMQVSDSHQNEADINQVIDWLINENIKVLNVAGPRESTCPGIYNKSFNFLNLLLSKANEQN